jgi:hypothetical protein
LSNRFFARTSFIGKVRVELVCLPPERAAKRLAPAFQRDLAHVEAAHERSVEDEVSDRLGARGVEGVLQRAEVGDALVVEHDDLAKAAPANRAVGGNVGGIQRWKRTAEPRRKTAWRPKLPSC